MISREEVEHIAKLARLGLTTEEIERFRTQLSSVLEYMGKLKEVDTDGIEPMNHPILVENVMRQDRVKKEKVERINKLHDAVPDKKGGHVRVKAVL